MTPEGRVKKQVTDILRKVGAWWFMPVQTGYGKAGVPDILACYKGRFIAIETKATQANKPTKLQEIQLDGISKAGGLALVIHAGNIEELVDALGGVDADCG